jgi:hypothetical protein
VVAPDDVDRAEGSDVVWAGSKSKKVTTVGGAGERNKAPGTKILHSSVGTHTFVGYCHIYLLVNR